jgi:hypothetical protein
MEGPEERPLETSYLKGVEKDLKLRDTRKPARRSVAHRLGIAALVHKDL